MQAFSSEASMIDDADIERVMQHIMSGKSLGSLKGFTPDEIEAMYTIAYNVYQQRKFKQAEQVFSLLCLYNHLDVRFWLGLGACREALNQYQSAVEAYSFCGVLQIDNPTPPLRAAKCYLAMNQLDQAISGLTAAMHWSEGKAEHQTVFNQAKMLLKSIEAKNHVEDES